MFKFIVYGYILTFLVLPSETVFIGHLPDQTQEQIKAVQLALEYVRHVETNQCTGGTGEILTLTFDHTPWIQYTEPAVRTANFLTKILALDGDLSQFDESIYYSMVRNNVHGDTLIYGSAIAVEPGVIPTKPKYCPYAYNNRSSSTVTAFDIAISYDYQTNTTEWYLGAKDKDRSNVTITKDVVRSLNASTKSNSYQYMYQPLATYQDGYWTRPYFDCGGGNIWMSTYSAPILSWNNGTVHFRGVATIDIELTNIDINQCDLDKNEAAKALDIFRGTHSCQPTTVCTPLNQGFRAGSYLCKCQDGYYFPNTSAVVKAFRGVDIETYFKSSNSSIPNGQFQCLKCSRGCDTCVDSTPCLYQINYAVQAFNIFIISILIVGCIIVSAVIIKYKKELVIKTASPIFLLLTCLGATLMCSSVFVMYGEVTSFTCTLQIWPFNLGFVIMYGALLLKTWRISVIFKSGGATKRINLPDKALLQRMIPLVIVFTGYLSVWTALDPPYAYTVKTSSGLKFFTCSMTWWKYALYGGEALLLLVGVYLCFTVRKAPAHFNESKFITWATYNAIILGSFILMLTQFVGLSGGPDVVYVLLMAQQQVFVTITLALIFFPKFWALYRGTLDDSTVYANHVVTITGRVKQPLPPTTSRLSESFALTTASASVQCNPEDFFLISGYQEDDNLSTTRTTKFSSKVGPLKLASLQVTDSNGGHSFSSTDT
ncbi:probable G-protein coupled receptor CG31760 isoform X3 [Biomphalaria glabrata]|uniref:Probable G-protein coupled receptor CG31760 isoform X3 n=1 Tax=Biomphalaria glabrata TaxID=6526 RepID=A0A9W3A070_BIOGL|nr:probable G-protein coupled receptor CG31760 isoform X3 [Biomphalaria glabrata]